VRSANIASAVARLTGLKVSADESIRILAALGIGHKENDPTTFVSPSWRHDISIEEDLVEEVARHTGYENIADELPPAYGAGEYQGPESRKRLLRQSLVDLGFNEGVGYSFIDTKFDDSFETVPGILDEKAQERFVTLRDAVIEGAVRMRPTLLPGLLDAVKLNFNQQHRNLKLFEIGKAFAARSSEDGLPTERELLCVIVTGGETRANHAMSQREMDFYDAKGAIEAALDAVGFADARFQVANVSHLRSGQAATISINGKNVGSIGRLSEELSANYKFKQPVYVAELDLQTVLAEDTSPILYSVLPKYPSVIRDVSFLIDRATTFDEIRSGIMKQGVDLCREITFVDVYEGKGVATNERSLTIRLEYRSDERTLIEDEVDAVHVLLIERLEKDLNIRRRF
jgi:phenylalanyl-tRNA synthetase beta chain